VHFQITAQLTMSPLEMTPQLGAMVPRRHAVARLLNPRS